MSGTNHAHPTFGTCECGHPAGAHPWTGGNRVDFQAGCIMCDCRLFHAEQKRA